ncbi:glycosyltransferase family 2 protein [Sphingobium nicotianae]|uniref:Glycosyltransferase family 2 protein n=1 Tax=Sphingobium nicotianae TaxID=2782607 RepID=A0A9X1DCQ6_9SPHN|nr:glycosyltransferase family 2 protein [Sphingobium nicotianae]MBT2187504.1 glycosyltransferase family 2 protein [Sphingobium nicotianae]
MSFYTEFFLALLIRPVRALVALYWHATRRRVRARNQLRAIISRSPYVYLRWQKHIEAVGQTLAGASREMAFWHYKPRISIFLHILAETKAADVASSIASIEAQCYPEWELLIVLAPSAERPADILDQRIRCVASPASTDLECLDAVLADALGSHLLPMTPGGRLSPAALFLLLERLKDDPDASIVYGDQDEIDRAGRRQRPWFKPRWNAELFLAQDYLSSACLISLDCARSTIRPVDGVEGAAIYALLLSISALKHAKIIHLAKVIVHLPGIAVSDNQAARVAAVGRHVHAADGKASAGRFGSVKLCWPLPEKPPRVSIVIPTRDQVSLLRACIESVRRNTDYGNYEVLIVDNGSIEKKTKLYLEEVSRHPNFRILDFPGEFNFSAINNYAVAMSAGDYICLLNNDAEAFMPNWLGELMRYAIRDDVGAAGAKLLYPDGSIQHGGVVIGLGNAAGHAHRNLPDDDPGYFARAHVAHFVSAVTAACLVVSKAKFETVGGLDAEGFKVAFNDVDFCLMLERAGWRNVYVPHSVLIHHESKSRGKDDNPAKRSRYLKELDLLQTRWDTIGFHDPLHHPHLDRASETYVIHL